MEYIFMKIIILQMVSSILSATAYENVPCTGYDQTDIISIPNQFIKDMKISPIIDDENFIRLNVTFLTSEEFENVTGTIRVLSKDIKARCNRGKEHIFCLEEKQFLIPRFDRPADEDEIKDECEYIIDLNVKGNCILFNDSFIVPSSLRNHKLEPEKSTECNVLGKIDSVILHEDQILKVNWAFESTTSNLTDIVYYVRARGTVYSQELKNATHYHNHSLVVFENLENNINYELMAKFISEDCYNISTFIFEFSADEERIGLQEEYYENSYFTIHIIYFMFFIIALCIIVALIITKTKSVTIPSPPSNYIDRSIHGAITPTNIQFNDEKPSYVIVSNSDCEDFREIEINPRTVSLGKHLGGGAFGDVYCGDVESIKEIDNTPRKVAVKIPKDSSPYKTESILEEIRTMQKIGTHPNIVKLLGCCTREIPYMIIMELVDDGKSLKAYLKELRKRWEITKANSYQKYRKMNWGSSGGTVWHIPKSEERESPKEDIYIEMKNILDSNELKNFALQVARGMEHLEKRKIIHRDLAARNILMTRNKVLKISDFGMSKTEAYFSHIPYKQPARWMALESLKYKFFNTKTDVWSFGVVLWELGTLGALPYKEVDDNLLIFHLSQGTRLGKPQICTNEIYSLMQKCWMENPNLRPTFKELVRQLDAEVNKIYVINNVQEITPPSMLFRGEGSVYIPYESEESNYP
ncbi:hypothetical protein WA026_006942 [Henosepilachna vigintioctopunctata]|uniref:Protein kinase domain-containing protein n=1 Tax=Henosepilachna vigintioctopunctata TaxID=420089 RepID=A0AAW1V8U6_9CUCU